MRIVETNEGGLQGALCYPLGITQQVQCWPRGAVVNRDSDLVMVIQSIIARFVSPGWLSIVSIFLSLEDRLGRGHMIVFSICERSMLYSPVGGSCAWSRAPFSLPDLARDVMKGFCQFGNGR